MLSNLVHMRQFKIQKSITYRSGTAIDQYLKDINRYELITPEQEVDLAQRIRKGDLQALDTLVSANLRFVVSVAKNYQSSGMPLIDLINEGNLGLIKAAQRFDETRGFKFISYAVWWIRQNIMQSIAEYARQVRLPLNKVSLSNKVYKLEADFMAKHEREPSDEELALIADESVSDIAEIRGLQNYLTSLDAPVGDPEGEVFLDKVANPHAPTADEEVFDPISLQHDLTVALSALKPKEREVVQLFFGFGTGCGPMNLDEIASRIGGLTRERARQIKNTALDKMAQNKKIQEKLFKYMVN